MTSEHDVTEILINRECGITGELAVTHEGSRSSENLCTPEHSLYS